MRIIDAFQQGNDYIIDLEGLTASSDTLSVWSYYLVNETVDNAILFSINDRTTKFLVEFEAGESKYSRKRIVIKNSSIK